MQPTFKEYLEISRRELEEAMERTPICTTPYTIKRYCKLMVGESLKSKETIQLKPKHQVEVKWVYENMESPTPVHITFNNVSDIDNDVAFDLYWSGEQLTTWLSKNANKS